MIKSNKTNQKNDLTTVIYLSTKFSRKYTPDKIIAAYLYSKLSKLTFLGQLLTTLLPIFHNIKKLSTNLF